MNPNERVSPEALRNLLPVVGDARVDAQQFINANGLKDRLSIGSKIGEGLMLEDTLAIEMVSGQIGALESKIRGRRLNSLSRRRILGAYARLRISQLEDRKADLFLAFDYLVEERKLHREQNCRTPQQLKSAGIIMMAADELILIADEKGVPIAEHGRFKDEDLSKWQDKYKEQLYAVT